MKSQEDIDRLVRERLLRPDQSGDDWDVPSEDVWTAVEKRIQKKPRRHVGIWWIFGGALLFILTLFLIFRFQKPTSVFDAGVVELTQPLPVDASASVHSELAATGSISESQIANPLSEIENTKTPEAGNTNQNPGTSRPIKDHESSAQSLIKTSDMIRQHTATGVVVNSVHNVSAVSTVSQTDLHEKTTTAAETVSGLNTEVQSPFAQKPWHQLAFLVSGVPQLTLTNTALPVVRISPIIPGPRRTSSWSLMAAFTPSFGTRKIVVPNAQPRVRRDLLIQQEEPKLQPGFSISALHEINFRWAIDAGIAYSRFLLNSSSSHQIRYSRIGERPNAQGNFENQFRLHLNTSYGEVSTDVLVVRSSDAQIPEHQFINLTLETRQSMQVLRIPLSVRYQVSLKNCYLSCYGGISANVLLENSLQFRTVQSLNSEIIQVRAMRDARLSGFKDFAIGYQVGVGMEIPLDRKWSILAGPALSGYLQPVYQNRQVIIYPFTVQLDVGIRYRL